MPRDKCGVLLLFVATTGKGGIERYIATVLQRLVEEFEEVVIVTGREGEMSYWKYYEECGANVVCVGASLISIARLLRVVSLVQKYRPDIVCDFRGIHSALDLAICKLVNVKTRVLFFRNSMMPGDSRKSLRRLVNVALRALSVSMATRVLGNSHSVMKAQFGRTWTERSKFAVIYNGVHPSFLARGAKVRNCRRQLSLIHVGRFFKQKNQATLIRSLSLLEPGSVQSCAFIGDGPLLSNCKRLASEVKVERQCLFYGYCSDVASILREADFFVFPSHHEGMPNALIEAMACGVVPIVSRVPENLEFVPPELHEYSFHPDDYIGLSESLSRARTMELERYVYLSELVHDVVRERYSCESAAAKLVACLRAS